LCREASNFYPSDSENAVHRALFKYDSLVEQCYRESGVDGKFEDITKTVLR